MEQREKDIQVLCEAVKNMLPTSTGDYGSGAMCPFCYKDCYWNAHDLSQIEHEPECPVLIAKDLSTNSIPETK